MRLVAGFPLGDGNGAITVDARCYCCSAGRVARATFSTTITSSALKPSLSPNPQPSLPNLYSWEQARTRGGKAAAGKRRSVGRVARGVAPAEMPVAMVGCLRLAGQMCSAYLRIDQPPGRPTAPGNRVARGGTQGGPNRLTHAPPRCLPTPTAEADGGGEPIDRAEGSLGPPSRVLRIPPVPLLWTGVLLHLSA